ncbi:MAG: OPT/YSL family transporter, partial [Acidobacteria bacterium]|nr:OPT/YSL family transporter [Acidobacteriota bacterium]
MAQPAAAPADPELHWLQHTRRDDSRQLTVRAVVLGMLLGGVMCLSNLYVFFKTGWSMGVTITAAILAFALLRLLAALRLSTRPLTAL